MEPLGVSQSNIRTYVRLAHGRRLLLYSNHIGTENAKGYMPYTVLTYFGLNTADLDLRVHCGAA